MKSTEQYSDRVSMLETLDAFYDRALAHLEEYGCGPNTEIYEQLCAEFHESEYMATLANVLQSFNFPELGINPKASAEPITIKLKDMLDSSKCREILKNRSFVNREYRDRLPMYGAILVTMEVPKLWQVLNKNGERDIDISRTVDLMNGYSKIVLADMTYGVPKAIDKSYSKRQSNAARNKKGKEGKVKLAIRMIIEENDVRSFNDLVRILQDSDYIEDLYYRDSPEKEPIDIHEISINKHDDKLTMNYRNRKNEEKTLSEKSLRNILTKIK